MPVIQGVCEPALMRITRAFALRGRPLHAQREPMPLGVAAEFSEEEAAQLEALRDPNEPPLEGDGEPPVEGQAKQDAGEQPPPNDQPPEGEQPAAAGATEPPKAAEPPKQDPPSQPGPDHRQALRASRHAERQARQQAAQEREARIAAEARIAELTKGAAAADPDAVTDEEIADFPVAGKLARKIEQIAAAVKPAAAAPAADPGSDPEFEPVELDPRVQAVVDEIDALSDWQYDPDQTRFAMAQAETNKLMVQPKWKAQPFKDVLLEVVRRVNAELADTPPAPQQTPATPRADPAKVIEAAPTRTPSSLGDLGAGGGKVPTTNDLSRFGSMSAEDVEAELMARG